MKGLLAVLLAVVLLTGCNNGIADEMEKSDPSQTQWIENTSSDNMEKGALITQESPSPAHSEVMELHTLEKEFLQSELCRREALFPLAYTRDRRQCIAYRTLKSPADADNETILIGMPSRQVEVFVVDLDSGKQQKAGKTGFVINCAWSADGKLLALVSQGEVKILDITTGKMWEISLKYAREDVHTANWDRKGHILYIHLDRVANYYAYDADARTMLRIRGQFTGEDRVYRGNAGGYDLWSRGDGVGVALGLLSDWQEENLLYSGEVIVQDTMGSRILVAAEASDPGSGVRYRLEDVNLVTGEKKQLVRQTKNNERWSLYKASYIKSTGDIIYTVFDTVGHEIVYKLVHVKQDGSQSEVVVPSPLYTLTPGETLVDFATFDGEASFTLDPVSFVASGRETRSGTRMEDICEVMLKALQIYSSEEPDEDRIRSVFINTYDPIPQEALENILLYGGLPGRWRFERLTLPKRLTMKIKLHDNGNRATVAMEPLYFWGPHELVKQDGRWYITGFSTWYGHPERDKVKTVCEKYMASHASIPGAKSVAVGEIEFWAFSDPHRVSPFGEYMAEARVKLIVTFQDGRTEKRQLYASRKQDGRTWRVKHVGELRPGL